MTVERLGAEARRITVRAGNGVLFIQLATHGRTGGDICLHLELGTAEAERVRDHFDTCLLRARTSAGVGAAR